MKKWSQRAVGGKRSKVLEVGLARFHYRAGVIGAFCSVGVTEVSDEGRFSPLGLALGIDAEKVMTMSRRYPPEVLGVGVQGLLAVIERDGRGIEAIIATGTGAQLQELRDVESEDLESAQPRNVRWGHEVVDGAVEGDVLGIAESHAHADDAYLGVDWAGICRELGDRALRCGMGVADETSRKFDYRVFCVLAIAGIFAGLQYSILDREVDLNVGVTTRLGCGGKRRVFGDRSVCLRRGGDRSKSSQHASGHANAIAAVLRESLIEGMQIPPLRSSSDRLNVDRIDRTSGRGSPGRINGLITSPHPRDCAR